MAVVGATIGLMFAVSMMAGPVLYRLIGMAGMFSLMGVLSLLAILVTVFLVPPGPAHPSGRELGREGRRSGVHGVPEGPAPNSTLTPELLRLHYGIFALQTVQMALFVVVPTAMVEQAGLPVESHWKVYVPVVALSLLAMMPPLRWAERSGHLKGAFLGAVAVMLAVQLALFASLSSVYAVAACLVVYFAAFNLLAAILPSLVSRMAPAEARGTAIGVYNTMQSLGSFAGGAAGGLLMQHFGGAAVFLFGCALIASWLIIALPMRPPART
jgi:predicted MFS family arabinose efflux permease